MALAVTALLMASLAACGDSGAAPVCAPPPTPDLPLPDAPTQQLINQDIVRGEGEVVTTPDALVMVDYIGRAFSTKRHFDSSFSRPQPETIGLDQVIVGWRDGIQGMAEGGCRRLTVPGSLAYSDNPPVADIGINDTLVFDVELHRILTAPTVEVPSDVATAPVFTDLRPGIRNVVGPGSTVTVHYRGVIASTGAVFQSTWDAGEPFTFALDAGLRGFREGLQGMTVGGRRQLVLPPALAFGDSPPAGSGIGPTDTLVFVVDLISVTESE
jgi:peptidylprolyl isomerase